MNTHPSEFDLVVVANEHCARFLKFLRDEYRLIEQTTIVNPTCEPINSGRFAQRIAQRIEALFAGNVTTGVCLIAPQPFLSLLFSAVSRDDPKRITATRAADLTALSEDHVLVRITDLVSTLEPG